MFMGKIFSKRLKEKRIRVGLILISIILALGILPGCAEPGSATTPSTTPATQEPAVVYPLTIKDGTRDSKGVTVGREMTFTSAPQRIVSLAPSNTEIVYALGLGDKLVGNTTYCDYPEAAKSVAKVGGYSTAEVEKIVALKPDLILAANIHAAKVVPQLISLNLPVFVVDPRSLQDVLDSITLVGKVTNVQAKAANVVKTMNDRINAVKAKTATLPDAERVRTLMLIWHDPPMTVGPNTFMFELIQLAGGTSVSKGMADGFPTMGLESIISADPQVVITTGMGGAENLTLQYIKNEPRLKDIPARKDGRVYEVNQDWTNRMGPRVVDGLEAMAKLIHPELFK
ncbi:ABC transporter substrate-binding protein [Dehalogenimonas alkenigignens]|uniref:ABC-type Fe3+-hydroxamate transport system, periplasmic component n=1 Tax=Dehalogenimonas alkenigignens TaxID=1217799 RepID=A0A0W0GJ71_9CHLR|nr:cobalamin-binding protein [Dehalogenimonas alkenigignens]KTB48590.1 ABC-type Fe3+-hydroxamate transport system, periplasmic component [Dehalogenimonas alkenigignens]PVV84970.1 cobalamin-binding protein [Dehalogenimonas alkenigignens]